MREYGDAIAAVTVARGAAPAVDRFVGSVRAATARPVHVVVADIAGVGAPRGVEVLPIPEDVGRGAAANRVTAGLHRDVAWVVIADPQVQWPAGALDTLLRAGERYPRAGVLGPRLRDPSGAVLPSTGPLPTALDLLGGRVRTGGGVRGPVGWVSATCLLMRRAAWDSVDGFDPRYLGPWDDVDLCDRLGRAGWLAVHVPEAEVTTGPPDGQGILEPGAAGLRRYARDRCPVALQALVRVAGRLRAARPGTTPSWRSARAG